MKKVFLLIFTNIVLLLLACQDYNDDFAEVKPNYSTKASFTITQEEAVTIATVFLENLNQSTRSISKQIGNIGVWGRHNINSLTRSTSILSDTLVYIVNLQENNGYLLVSADSRYKKVLAYVETGNVDSNSLTEDPNILYFLNGAIEHINTMISEYTEPLEPRPEYPLAGSIRILNPLVKTTWHQRAPFNIQCPTINDTICLAGCGPIAISQILAYHKKPETYNGYSFPWDSISVKYTPQTEIGKYGAAYLVHQIGLLANATYGIHATGVKTWGIENALKSMNYSYHINSYSYNLCKQSIENKRPILITGRDELQNAGHAWIIDDYYEDIETIINELADGGQFVQYVVRDKYVHCNWGWTDNSNGYFLSGVFDTQEKKYEEDSYIGDLRQGNHHYNFSKFIRIYTNIHPKN